MTDPGPGGAGGPDSWLRLADAVAAAQDAYRNTARVIRLLAVLGQPSAPEELVQDTLTVLSAVFSADVTCVAQLLGGRLLVTASCGLSEDDPAFTVGWQPRPTAVEALRTNRPVARHATVDDDPDGCPLFSWMRVRGELWIPLSSGSPVGNRLLVLFRGNDAPFTDADLQMTNAVAYRLGLSLEARERSVALERLAQSGHRLARHLDLDSLLWEAVEVLRQLTAADRTWALLVEDGQATVHATATATATGTAGTAAGGSVAEPTAVQLLPGWETLVRGQPYRSSDPGAAARTMLCVPVMRDGSVAVLLSATRDRSGVFGQDAVESAMILANHVGAALVNAELYEALARSESSLRLITDSVSDLIALVDSAGRFQYASPAHAREVDHDPELLRGRPVSEFVHPHDVSRLATALADVCESSTVEYRLRTGRGGWLWVESVLRPAPSDDGTVVLSSRVVDERRRLEDELRWRATHDPLTGLANRVLAVQGLAEALGRGTPAHVGVLFCDLDEFKAVNDRLGHEAGDELLQQVAARFLRCVRPGDILARLGGDEFVFVLDGVGHLAEVAALGDQVQRSLDLPCLLRGEHVSVSVSVGGVLGLRGRASPGAMLRDADAAMYAAKAAGRGRVQVFDDAASHRSLDLLDLRSELAYALERDQLSVHYQPIVELVDGGAANGAGRPGSSPARAPAGDIIGFEALLRWTHPVRGAISPEVFVPLAEESGAIIPIGQWMLEQSCRQLAAWRRLPAGRNLTISVNLAASQLRRPSAVTAILETIAAAGVDPADVWLEVTERSYINDDAISVAAMLHESGVHFALDDFGVSYSNLGYLQRFPIESLKIDKSFVAQLAGPVGERNIVRGVLALARSLDLRVVAEGIETRQQYDFLVAMGCRYGQGYLLSRPIAPAAATSLLIASPAPEAVKMM